MKKILIDEKLNFYRANLHCHSTISDGRKTPEELKCDYMKNGYSVIAYTDHDIYVNHDDLTDGNFVALNGYELDVSCRSEEELEDGKTCHLCYIALDKENDLSLCFNKDKYVMPNGKKYIDSQHYLGTPDYERVYSEEGVNEMIALGRENGFFVTYNHPTWSLESYPQYSRYRGMNAMEIYSFASEVAGWDDDNGHCYDDLLNLGNRIFCIATDDNHNRVPDTDPRCGSYGGYTVINAPELEYSAITKALVEGSFYSSSGNYIKKGPEIKSLVYEDGKVTIKTSEARQIMIMHNIRRCSCENALDGESITGATFDVENAKWFRIVVIDNYGFKAYTNAYFIDELK